ncbi:MAG: hypothetical protein JWO88_3624 [Frankiales bacterium]|nr:hypothetical protein [Frankiales bacterium]
MKKKKKRGGWVRRIDWNVEPWATFAFHHNVGPKGFLMLRKGLAFTQDTCGQFLGVDRDTICRWEKGHTAVPRSAVLTLVLLSESRHLTITNRQWDGWHIARDGRLYTPDGCYSWTAEHLRAWWIESQLARTAKETAKELQTRLDAAIQENTELRALFVNAGVIDELDAMQRRVGELVQRLNTAQVIPFPKPPSDSKEAAA